MSVPQLFEVAVGLIVVYYILGAVVSTVTQIVTESLETRGAALEQYLLKLAGDKTVDLTNLPQIKALRPIRYANWWNVLGAGVEEKKVEKIPADTLVNAFFDITGLTAQQNMNVDGLTSTLSKLPDSEGKAALLGWINQGVTNINDLKSRTNDYISGTLNQASLTFKARARSFVIIFSLGITLLFGTDSIQLAKDLWADAGLRAVAAQQAAAITSQGAPSTDVTQLLNQLGNMSFRIGWWQAASLPAPKNPIDWLNFIFLKALGLMITAVAVSQGSSFWYDILKKVTGASSAPASSGGDGSSSDSSGGPAG
jgi:hypothetical protein